MLWVKFIKPLFLFLCLLVLDSIYIPASAEKQTVQFDQSARKKTNVDSTKNKEKQAENTVAGDEAVVVDTTDNSNNSTLYNIEVDFTSTVVENGE